MVSHFWNLPYFAPLVEVARAEKTSDQTFEVILELTEEIGMDPGFS